MPSPLKEDPLERSIQYINTVKNYVAKQKESGIKRYDLGDLIFTAAESVEDKISGINPGTLTATQKEASRYATTLKEIAYNGSEEDVLLPCMQLEQKLNLLQMEPKIYFLN